jgi:DNA (cytosine-5)-methyltransferase 1
LNFPEALHFTEDIHNVGGKFCADVRQKLVELGADELFLMTCTAPCQGMSKSGQGTLLNNIRLGKRPKLDPRNRLILPALDIIIELRPRWVVFENVLEMRTTMIADKNGNLRPILDIIKDTLGYDYEGEAYDVEVANYGVPQRRQRLITVYTRDEIAKQRLRDGLPLVPPRTHGASPNGLPRWISVQEALQGFPPLDSIDKAHAQCGAIPYHYVPVLDPKKYEWIRHTPPGSSAFDNQCANPDCLYKGNPNHGNFREDGINRARKDTTLYCQRCGELLPRPYTKEIDGGKRIMSGFTSAYKRMEADLPAPALTRNFSYPCSDNKVHPLQNRVLSLAEAMHLQTISQYHYQWGPVVLKPRKPPQFANDGLIRLVIGESVPPKFFEQLGVHIQRISSPRKLPDTILAIRVAKQLNLL